MSEQVSITTVRLRQYAVSIPALAAFVTLLLFSMLGWEQIGGVKLSTWFGLALVALVASKAFAYWNWRCPACGKPLQGWNPKGCGACKKSFQ